MSATTTGGFGQKACQFFTEDVASVVLQSLEALTSVHKGEAESASGILQYLREQKEKRDRQEGQEGQLEQANSSEEEENLFNTEAATTENMLTKEITEEEQLLMEHRIAQQQRQFDLHKKREERKKLKRIIDVADYLSREEALRALKACKDDEEEAILRFADDNQDYLTVIRREIAQEGGHERGILPDTEDDIESKKKRRIRVSQRKSTKEDRERLTTYVYKRLTLKDALKSLQKCDNLEEAMKDWSPARQQAYKLINENPNAYYYRFNAPGDEQKNGAWTKEEAILFEARLAECGADGQWGIFSMKIPGRVGYQCSNYYRSQIEKGKMKDPNYFLDEKGKARYLFKNKSKEPAVRRFKRKGSDDDDDDDSGSKKDKRAKARRVSPKPAKKRGKGRRRGSDDDSDSDVDENDMTADKFNYKPDRSFYTTKRLRIMHGELNEADMEETPNPLPGVIDPITLDEVVMPAISPTGHVM
eukprot:Ihof_evm1s803 gene=Ihof_evmTU1s803